MVFARARAVSVRVMFAKCCVIATGMRIWRNFFGALTAAVNFNCLYTRVWVFTGVYF